MSKNCMRVFSEPTFFFHYCYFANWQVCETRISLLWIQEKKEWKYKKEKLDIGKTCFSTISFLLVKFFIEMRREKKRKDGTWTTYIRLNINDNRYHPNPSSTSLQCTELEVFPTKIWTSSNNKNSTTYTWHYNRQKWQQK